MRFEYRLALAVVTVSLLAALAAAPSALATDLPAGFQDTEVFGNLSEPTVIRFAADGKAFISERKGKILVYDSLSDPTPTVFADLSEMAYDRGDRGILGMTLDPKFTEGQPYVYVLYTYNHILGDPAPPPKWEGSTTEGDPCPPLEGSGGGTPDANDCPVSGRLVRLTAEGDHAKEVGGKPLEEVLVEGWCQQFDSHSIGALEFDAEGNLWASAGEGASYDSPDYGQFGLPEKNQCGDPPGQVGEELQPPTARGGSLRSQNRDDLDGKLIRVDPNSGQGLPGNPLYEGGTENEKRIVAMGFRNPFRFTIDPSDGEVYVGNVGWNSWEEIDRVPAPVGDTPAALYNSGWPCYEGPEKTEGWRELGLEACESLYRTPGSTSPPFFAYRHGEPITPEDPCPTQYGSVINGLAFYEGSQFPGAYKGALFFADGARQCIYVMFPGSDGAPDPSTVQPFMTNGGLYPTAVDLTEGPEGALYYVNLFGPSFDPNGGTIHRIAYTSGNQPPVARLSVDHRWGKQPLTVHFDASGSSDADGESLSYEWDFNESGTFAPGSAEETRTFNDSANHTVAVRVTDQHAASSVAKLTIYANDTPPEPRIEAPEASLEWHVGQPIHFAGSASDEEQGQLPAADLSWNSVIRHCPSACHVHPLQAFPAVAAGELIAPEHDYPSAIELSLTATDERGLAATKTVTLYPEIATIEMESCPSGVEVTAGVTGLTPFSATVIRGSHLTLAAPSQVPEGTPWSGWSDGGERVHTVTVGSDATYKAFYGERSCSETVSPPPGTDQGQLPSPKSGPPGGQQGGGSTAVPPEPATTLAAHPPKLSRSTTARFRFRSDTPGARFRYRLDGGHWRRGGSTLVLRHLRAGPHQLVVEATGSTGSDQTPLVFSWRVLRTG